MVFLYLLHLTWTLLTVSDRLTGYQKNYDGVTRKLALGTIDDSPKKDLVLKKEAKKLHSILS